jgi:hypothetical protein
VHLQGIARDGNGGYLEDGGDRLDELLAVLRSAGYKGSMSVVYRWPGVTWERAASARAWLRARYL